MNVHPYYVYMHDLVKGVEDLRTTLQTGLDIEKRCAARPPGSTRPTFVVDAPGGGGKRDAHSYEHYDRETGISVYTAPACKPGEVYFYFDPIDQLARGASARWADPAEHIRMVEEAQAAALAAPHEEGRRPCRARTVAEKADARRASSRCLPSSTKRSPGSTRPAAGASATIAPPSARASRAGRVTALARALAGPLRVATTYVAGAPEETCDYVYVLCLGRPPSLVDLREGVCRRPRPRTPGRRWPPARWRSSTCAWLCPAWRGWRRCRR